MSNKLAIEAKSAEKELYKRWTKPLIDAGYTVIPSIIVRRMGVLGLSPLDFAILAQLASYWWDADSAPHPSVKTIADGIGASESAVKRRIKIMVAAKFLKKTMRPQPGNRHKTNEYEFGPLIEAVKPHALKELEAIAERQEAKKKSLTKKGKPDLKVVQEK